jgi:hypothetical protein
MNLAGGHAAVLRPPAGTVSGICGEDPGSGEKLVDPRPAYQV